MQRIDFIKNVSVGIVGFSLVENSAALAAAAENFRRIPFKLPDDQKLSIPENQRVPFGWQAAEVNQEGTTIKLQTSAGYEEFSQYFLRISIAIDIRDEKTVLATIPGTDTRLGEFDIRYAPVFTPFEIPIDKNLISQIAKNGIRLTLTKGELPLWIFGESGRAMPDTFLPHLLCISRKTNQLAEFKKVFTSVSSVQTLGWRGGCVWDGLYELHSRQKDIRALSALQRQISLFTDGEGMTYENGSSIPIDGRVSGIEYTLPFAILAKMQPEHPFLEKVLAFWNSKKDGDGLVVDGRHATAEGCYTVAYPMAVIARQRQDKNLAQAALTQLRGRNVLIEDGDFNLRYDLEKKEYTFKNWARGAAWFLLGSAHTLRELEGLIDPTEQRAAFKKAVDMALNKQNEQGLWHCFMEQTDVLPDTSGSAGIAAAIAIGVGSGFLPKNYKKRAANALQGLLPHLTPDGYLGGVAQDNRGGLELQSGPYRVLAQMGMGLLAQLVANVE